MDKKPQKFFVVEPFLNVLLTEEMAWIWHTYKKIIHMKYKQVIPIWKYLLIQYRKIKCTTNLLAIVANPQGQLCSGAAHSLQYTLPKHLLRQSAGSIAEKYVNL